MSLTIDENLRGKELFDFLIKNKNILIAEKKNTVKHSDAFHLSNAYVDADGIIVKAVPPVLKDEGVIQRACVINTCNIRDSHKDVHIPGLWKKSLSETRELYLCQEHLMTFKGIITDQVDAFTKMISWKELNVNYKGQTEALIFNSTISKMRNEFMYDQYRQGWVKNHSVGMRYVNIEMAIMDDDYKNEFAVWNKFFDQIVNKEECEEDGYFFAVRQAKVIEGSAVPLGSNWVTPTFDTFQSKYTANQPPNGTDKQPFNVLEAIKQTQFLNF